MTDVSLTTIAEELDISIETVRLILVENLAMKNVHAK
jgi:orotate phosphoribosyltransferase-like protein